MISRLPVKGALAALAWVRAFGAEAEVERVRRLMALEPEVRKWAASPWKAELELNVWLKFYIFVVLYIDKDGITDAEGFVWLVDPGEDDKASALREGYASEVSAELARDNRFDSVVCLH